MRSSLRVFYNVKKTNVCKAFHERLSAKGKTAKTKTDMSVQ